MRSLVWTWLRRIAVCSAVDRASATVARCASTCFFNASTFACAAASDVRVWSSSCGATMPFFARSCVRVNSSRAFSRSAVAAATCASVEASVDSACRI